MEKKTDEVPGWVKSGATGAALALALAIFTPAQVLLGLEAVVASGVYFYRLRKKKEAKKRVSEEIIDVTPEEEKSKEN